MSLKNYLIIGALSVISFTANAQNKKVWASGAARSVFQQNNLKTDGDTVTPKQLNSGHALVDIAINARPNDQTFLHAMVRVRNDFGGFWGSGVTFDMRQLYLKGLVKNAVRYQLGDINYRLTPYTFFNNQEELSQHQSEALNIYRDIMRYDMFYTDDNTWRQQGASVDFTLEFSKFIEEIEVNSFMFRNRPTDFGQQSERIFFGGNATLVQSKKVNVGLNYVDMMDIKGTSRSNTAFHNPVITGTTDFRFDIKKFELGFNSESGISERYTLNDPSVSVLRDYFYDLNLELSSKKNLPALKLNYINVGPQFRSVGAQSRRIDFGTQNLMYTRYGNEQVPRPVTQLDMLQDASLYQSQLSTTLQTFAPQYDNVQPYGKATPNRQGISVTAGYMSKKKVFDIEATYRMLSEIVGQGSDELRSFSVLNANGTLYIDTLIPSYKNELELSFGLTNQQTERSTTIPQGNIDLKSLLLDVGLKIGVSKDFAILGNYRIINAQGNELMNVRETSGEIIDFQPFTTDMKQNQLLIALRYKFDAKNHINVVWQQISFEDSADEALSKFDLNQFGIVYSMHF